MPPPRTERSPLPVELDARLSEMVATYHRAQAETAAKIDAIILRAKDLPMQANYRFDGETLKFLVVPTRGSRGGMQGGNPLPKIEAVRAQIAAIAEEYAAQISDMLTVRAAIRDELGQALNLTKPEEIDRVLLTGLRIANQRQAENSFSEYRTAVFEPGLSPEQRRLLFDAVVERLELPLPRGDLQASMRAETW